MRKTFRAASLVGVTLLTGCLSLPVVTTVVTQPGRRVTAEASTRILAQDPMFGSLRGNEEFQALLSRMAEEVAREDQRVEVEGLASVIDSMIVAGIRDEGSND